MYTIYGSSYPNALDAALNMRLLDMLSLKGGCSGAKTAQVEYPLYNGLLNSSLVIPTPESLKSSYIF